MTPLPLAGKVLIGFLQGKGQPGDVTKKVRDGEDIRVGRKRQRRLNRFQTARSMSPDFLPYVAFLCLAHLLVQGAPWGQAGAFVQVISQASVLPARLSSPVKPACVSHQPPFPTHTALQPVRGSK